MESEQRGHKDRLLYELTGQVSFPFMAVGLYAISSGQLIMQIAFIRTVRAGDCFYCQQDNRKRIEEQDCFTSRTAFRFCRAVTRFRERRLMLFIVTGLE